MCDFRLFEIGFGWIKVAGISMVANLPLCDHFGRRRRPKKPDSTRVVGILCHYRHWRH